MLKFSFDFLSEFFACFHKSSTEAVVVATTELVLTRARTRYLLTLMTIFSLKQTQTKNSSLTRVVLFGRAGASGHNDCFDFS